MVDHSSPHRHIAITFGSVTFQVHDRTAHASAVGILTRTATLATAVFGP